MATEKTKQMLETIRQRLSELTPEEVIQQLHECGSAGPSIEEFIEGFGWPQVYLAGFDVFRQDGLERGAYLKDLCSEKAMVGLYPFDNEVDQSLPPAQMAAMISQMNMDMIRRADAVLANLNCFRGLEPDSGTVFEVGMAIALGKPVWVYFDGPETLRKLVPHDAGGYDAEGFMVEDFGLPMNLMLACTWAGHSKTVEEAVPALASTLWAAKQQKEVERQAYLKMIQETEHAGLDGVWQGNLQPPGLNPRPTDPDDSVTGLER
jgi:nucleoside 2-deoxyribosyltransferase